MTGEATGLAAEVRAQIRLALRLTGVPQAELARRIGVSKKHVWEMLNDRAAISLDMAEKMMTALGRVITVQVREDPPPAPGETRAGG